MTLERDVDIALQDSPAIDAFDRFRVSNPLTIFDSKQIFDNQPLFWDDAEETGSDTTSTHSVDTAMSTIGVANLKVGKRTRQTFRKFNYQSGKGQSITMTGVLDLSGGGSGITQRLGYFDDENGFFFENDDGVVSVVLRSKVTGSVIDTKVIQSNWNLDTMDGEGVSEINMDWGSAHIFIMDFEWLGVGRARFGMYHRGVIVYVHEFINDNTFASAYMSTPNLPLRYQIENDGDGGAATLGHICATVISEGGVEDNGILRYKSTEGDHINADVANTVYAVVGMRLKSTHLDATIKLTNFSMLSETNDDFEWLLLFNPTVAGTPVFANETNSAVQTYKGAIANTVTGGISMDGGFAAATKDGGLALGNLKNALLLGSKIDGTPDEIVLCVRPLSTNADIQGSLTWREL